MKDKAFMLMNELEKQEFETLINSIENKEYVVEHIIELFKLLKEATYKKVKLNIFSEIDKYYFQVRKFNTMCMSQKMTKGYRTILVKKEDDCE